MVFLTALRAVRSRGPDEFWRKRRIFRLAAHYRGRVRNCYVFAVRAVHRALVYATKGRDLRRQQRRIVWNARISAGAQESGLAADSKAVLDGLDMARVAIDSRALSDLAAWEGRSFSALAALSRFALGRGDEPLGRLYFRNRIS